MSDSTLRRKALTRGVLCVALSALFCVLLFLQLVEGRLTAQRTVGVYLEMDAEGYVVLEVDPALPAARAGLLAGDRIRRISGNAIEGAADYDRAARDFEPSLPQTFTVEREGALIDLVVSPGIPFLWGEWAFKALVAMVHLGLGLLVLAQPGRDIRGTLLWVLLVAIGIELAMPSTVIGAPAIGVVAECVFWLLTGLQFGVELHLASVLPQPQPWFRARRWPRALYYGLGAAFGLVMFAGTLPGGDSHPLVAWTWTSVGTQVAGAFFMIWALGVVLLLGNSALRWPEPEGRHQATLVFMGVFPWAVLTSFVTFWDLSGYDYPAWIEPAESLIFLMFPVAVFIAIYRYQLFDLGVVVRRSLLYGALSASLLLVFYATLGVGGAALASLLEGTVPMTWVVAGATLVLGLAFSPMKRFLEHEIERRLFPEKAALRERMSEMVRDLPGRGQLQAMAETLVADIVDIFAVDGACVLVADRDSELLVGRASAGCGDAADGLLVPRSDPFIEFLGERGRATVAAQWPAGENLARSLRQMGGALVVPVMRGGEITGLMVLGEKSDGGGFGAEELELLDLLSHHVATVLENAHLFESATRDALTGLLRREAVLVELERELERALRYGRPLTVAMVDVDRFKAVNDRFGHLAGDQLLRRVAGVLEDSLRSTDLIGRYGGEEFLVLLPESDAGAARAVVEKLREAVEALESKTAEGVAMNVTISIGLANLGSVTHGGDPTPEDLIEAADRSLYHAKRAGRNRVAMGVTRWAMG